MVYHEAADAIEQLKIAHEEKRVYSSILSRTVIQCANCKALKGSREWTYDCRGTGNGQKKEDSHA